MEAQTELCVQLSVDRQQCEQSEASDCGKQSNVGKTMSEMIGPIFHTCLYEPDFFLLCRHMHNAPTVATQKNVLVT